MRREIGEARWAGRAATVADIHESDSAAIDKPTKLALRNPQHPRRLRKREQRFQRDDFVAGRCARRRLLRGSRRNEFAA